MKNCFFFKDYFPNKDTDKVNQFSEILILEIVWQPFHSVALWGIENHKMAVLIVAKLLLITPSIS